MANEIKLTIDGKEIIAEEGQNLVSVANENGVFIPSLCYNEKKGQSSGTCRVCTCNVNGQPGAACMEKVKDGMEVEVEKPDLENMRKAIVEMMLAEGNHFCPSCEKSGFCDLQHMGYEMGLPNTRYTRLFENRKIDYNAKRIILENNRCIKCLRCVEEVLTQDGKSVFSSCNRGNETVIGIDYEKEAELTEEEAIAAMKLCPTGAILVRGESVPHPFGKRRFDMQSTQKEKPAEPEAQPEAQEITGKKIVATTSLAGCFGCHMSLLDIDDGLLDVLEVVEFNKSPINDIKKFTKQCDIGIIEGGCCNTENIEVLKEFRKKCDVLVVVGECSVWGGLPAMRNMIPLEECLEEAYLNAMTAESEPGQRTVPYHEDIPKILDRVYACNEIVKIDGFIPGCPPSPEHMWKAVKNILLGEKNSILYSEFKYD